MRIPLAVDLHINAFSGGTITEYDRGLTNAIVEKVGSKTYISQRPAIDVFGRASTLVSDAKGRGVHYWDENSALYLVNNGTLYKGTYATNVGAVTAGTKRVYFEELNSKLIIIDPENDKGWTVTTGDTLAEITDADFPPKQTPAVGLAHGAVVLDKYLFVLGEDGVIYNSDVNNATAWTALNEIEAERSTDKGIYIARHHDDLAVFGVRTIEVFYDNSNPSGSPFNRRADVFHNTGLISGESVWETGDDVYFIGTDNEGHLGVYLLRSFQVQKISDGNLDAFITQAVTKDSYTIACSGLSANGHQFLCMTFHTTTSVKAPETTIVFDVTAGIKSEWSTTVGDLTNFPLIGWTTRSGTRYGEGIMFNGDLITLNNFGTQDAVASSKYVDDGYVGDYVEESTGENVTIPVKSRTGQVDFKTRDYKIPKSLSVAGDRTPNSQTLTIKHSDNKSDAFNAGRTIDISGDAKLTRLGRFRRRNYQLELSSTDKFRLEELEMEL